MKHSGAKSELIACAWLLGQGYEVFRNVSSHGEVDVVAIKSDRVLRLDIKSATVSPHTGAIQGGKLSQKQIELGVVPLCVLPDGTCHIIWAPTPKAEIRTFHCEQCGSAASGLRKHQRFCSKSCGRLHWRAKNGRREKGRGIKASAPR